jgi:hypothetical protein
VIGQRGSIARTLTGLAGSVSSDARQVRSAEEMSQMAPFIDIGRKVHPIKSPVLSITFTQE